MKSTIMKNANFVIVFFLREKRAYNMNSIVGDCCGHIYIFKRLINWWLLLSFNIKKIGENTQFMKSQSSL